MRNLKANIESLPLLNGILSGRLGVVIAMCALLQVLLHCWLAATNTVTAAATVVLAVLFLGGQALALLCTLLANGEPYQSVQTQMRELERSALAVASGSAIIGFLFNSIGCFVVDFLSPVSNIFELVEWGVVVAFIQALLVIMALFNQLNQRN